MISKILLTKEFYDEITSELKELKNISRKEVINEIQRAREHGDLRENAEYHIARERQSFIEGKIKDYEYIINNCEIINEKDLPKDKIVLGSKFRIYRENDCKRFVFQLVSKYEADIDKNKLSNESPLGKSLLNAKEGDSITVVINGKEFVYYVEEIIK